MSEQIRVTEKDLPLVDDNSLTGKQLQLLLKSTPKQYIKQRPAKGGGKWLYVDGGYIRKVLNLMFGWDWDFEILEQFDKHGEVVVKGRLTVRSGGRSVVKTQFGNKEIICKKGTDKPLSIGNDYKAAATDALKKCAFELGIASDVYNPEGFTPVDVQETSLDDLVSRLDELYDKIPEALAKDAQTIIENLDQKNYQKLWNKLRKY